MCADGRAWHSSGYMNMNAKPVYFTLNFDKQVKRKKNKNEGRKKQRRRYRYPF